MAKWSSFTPDHGLTLGSLYHWAKAEGWPGPSKIDHRERALQPSFALPAATFDCSIVC